MAAVEYDVAAVTNITHEHLDYHGSLEAYQQAKARLFRSLATSYRKPGVDKVAVLNRDDSSYSVLKDIPADRQYSYGLGGDADFRASEVSVSPGLHRRSQPLRVCCMPSPLVGRYNA